MGEKIVPVTETQRNPSTVEEVETVAVVQDATKQEHELSFFEALRLYRKGVFWSLVMSTAVIMEGYDTKLIGTLFAQPTFKKAFGVRVPGKESYQIPPAWQAGLSNGSIIGQLIGLLLSGYISERFGFRKTVMFGMVAIIGLIFPVFFAHNLVTLEVGQILFGIPLGLFQTIPVVYAFEVTPLCLRAYLTNYVSFCWAFGQLMATGVLRGVLTRTDQWAYRIPFGIQWIWPTILIPAIYFAPESPWWLVRVGRIDDAWKVVQRLTSSANVNFDIDKNIALMIATTEHERRINAETTYKACFQGLNLKRTLIVIGIYVIQNLNGNPIRTYSTYFLVQAGLPTVQAFNMTIVGFAIAIVGGFFSWVLLLLFGRRTIYINALCLMCLIMVLVGSLGIPQSAHPKSEYAWGIGALLLSSSFLYNCSIGPLTNTLCSEIPSVLLRSKSIVLARWVYAISSIIFALLTPYMLNPLAFNWGAKSAWLFVGTGLAAITFSFFCVPESKGRTTAEMDLLFERKVVLRHFSKAEVNLAEVVTASDTPHKDV